MTDLLKRALNEIPVYPNFGRFTLRQSLACDLMLIEDGKGRLAWVSEQAKKDVLGMRSR